jgi:predicted nucleic acid-binding protein
MGQLIIPDGAIVYVDTAPVIYTLEPHPDYTSRLQPLWEKLHSNKITIVSSELLWLETLVVPMKKQNQPLIELYTELLTDNIQLISIDETILKLAAQLRSMSSLKTPDAIHAATAVNHGCTVFLTNDAGLRNVSGLTTIVLKDLLSE